MLQRDLPIFVLVELLCGLYRVLGDSLDVQETLASFDQELQRVVRYEAITVHLVEGGHLQAAYAAGESLEALLTLESAKGSGFLEVALHTGSPSLNCKVTHVPRMERALVVPLQRGDGAMAVVSLYHASGMAFSDADLGILQAVGPKLATAIENARQYQNIARVAGIDPLTGVLNARSLLERLDIELTRSRRRQSEVAVIQCAAEGIESCAPDLRRIVLRRMAETFRGQCREYDAIGWSGEKFVLVIAGISAPDFEEKLVRLNQAMEHLAVHCGLPLSITVGAAFYPEDANDSDGLLSVALSRLSRARRTQPVQA